MVRCAFSVSGNTESSYAPLITIPIQIILGLALMIWLALHFNIAMIWLLFLGLVLCGSIIGSTPKKRRTAQDNTPKS